MPNFWMLKSRMLNSDDLTRKYKNLTVYCHVNHQHIHQGLGYSCKATIRGRLGRPLLFTTSAPPWNSALFFPWKKLSPLPFGISRDKENVEDHKIISKFIYFNKTAITRI